MEKNSVIKTPKTVNIQLTGKCNLKCQYCFYANQMTALSDLTTENWRTIFSKLGNLGVMDVCLSGGEPFVRKDMFELIDCIIENRMRYSILSNGTLITGDVLEKFSVGKRKLRLNYIQVSIDGSNETIHNLSRPFSFNHAVRGLKLLIDSGFPGAVRVTINRHNLGDLENIARFLLEEIGLPSFSTNEAIPVGSGCPNQDEVSLNSIDQLKAMEKIGKLLEEYPGRISASAGPLAKWKMYAEMENARKTGVRSNSWTMGFLSSCGCVFSTIDILHDGSIVPCCMMPGLVMGNILTDDLEKIWQDHPTLWALRLRRQIPMSQVLGCEKCEWNLYCSGGCASLAYQLAGDFNQANPKDCYRLFLREKG